MAERLPLDGFRVVDLTRVYSGPYCTFLLAMAGAEVIKVELPEGESLRRRNAAAAAALPFAMLNANKRLVTADYKEARGRDMVLRLLRTADVLVENFRPGVADALGLGRQAARAVNPRLVYASTSGFGEDGPYRDYPAMDLTIQALSGTIASTGFPDGTPVKAGPAFADFSAGAHLYGAVVSALLHRERTGEALSPEVAMLDAMFPPLASSLASVAAGGPARPARTGNRHGGLSLCPYNVYPALDGQIAIICNHDRHWRQLATALNRADLRNDPRFATMPGRVAHMELVDAEVGRETGRVAREELFARLNAARVPCGPVRELSEVMADPQLHRSGMLQEVDHPEYGRLVLPHTVLRFRGRARVPYRPSGRLGRDNDAVWGEVEKADA